MMRASPSLQRLGLGLLQLWMLTVVVQSQDPSDVPSTTPTMSPSLSPTDLATLAPTGMPSTATPTAAPSNIPSDVPSATPSMQPSYKPSGTPSHTPSTMPSIHPTLTPGATDSPSNEPSQNPSAGPTTSRQPSSRPSLQPTSAPSHMPSLNPTVQPGTPTAAPTTEPTMDPTTPSPETSGARIVTMTLNNWNGNGQITNTDHLEEPINETFEQYWVEGLVPAARRRKLQTEQAEQAGIEFGRSQANIISQVIANDGNTNTLTYEQTIFYRIVGDNPWTTDEILTNTYDDPNYRQALLDAWKQPEPAAFADVSVDDLVPVITSPTEAPVNDDGDDGLSTGAIVGIVIAGVVGICILMILVMRCQEQPSESPAPARFTAAGDEDVSTILPPTSVAGGYGDQSVATVDYDYSKAYGGAGSVVSSAGGTMGENTRMTSEVPGTSRAALGAVASYDANVKEEVIEIQAPSGKLGVVIDTPDDGAPVVHAVKDSSVIADLIQVGDKLLAVDDEDVTSMTAIKVSKLISKKSANATRKLTVIRASVVEEP